MNLLLYNSVATTNPLHTIIPLTQYFHFTCYISGPFIFTKNNGNKSVRVTDTWLSIRDAICLAQRTQRTRSPPTSLHGATGAVGCFRHHLGNQGDSTLRLPEQPAWNDAGGGALHTSYFILPTSYFILPTSYFRLRSARTAGAEPPNVIAWRHRRSAISQRFCILREFEDFGGILFVSHRGHRGRGAPQRHCMAQQAQWDAFDII
jgi:hypothetical protein